MDVSDISTQQVEYPSKDGTIVRMFIVAAGEAIPAAPRPTIVYGYAGFRDSQTPAFNSHGALAWVKAGGVYVIVGARGGGEGGEAWHRAGMRENKQKSFDDFEFAQRHLIDHGWTTAAQLAIRGGSNGGLLVGAAITQHPELCQAAFCGAPLLDMIRYERFGLGATWSDEYGHAEIPVEFGWLLSYSPYHHVTSGVDYPAVLFSVSEGDRRVDPLHAKKMCAALQHASSGTRPILLRTEAKVGHSTRRRTSNVELNADALAFLAHHTGLTN